MQKSSSKNVCENDVKIIKKYVKMGAEIVEKSIKNHLRNHYGNLLVKILKKVRPRRPQERQKAIVAQGPRAQGAGKR